MNCTFVAQEFDGHDCDHLIDGIEVDDIWGWMLPRGIKEISDDYFGCVVWGEENGHLELEWETDNNQSFASEGCFCGAENIERLTN